MTLHRSDFTPRGRRGYLHNDTQNERNADKRDAEYKVAIEKCDALAGPAKETCVSNAKAQYGKS